MEEKKTSLGTELTKGIIKENPVLRLILGTVPHPWPSPPTWRTPSAWALPPLSF